MPNDLQYKRILLKLSGESLLGDRSFGIDAKAMKNIVAELTELVRQKVQVAIVIGAGNLFRGATLPIEEVDRVTADQIGILATVINALAMRDVFEKAGLSTVVMSAVAIAGMVEGFNRQKAIHLLESNQIVIFAGGTGNPLVTTDSAASLRAIEIGADLLVKATTVDGVYSADPAKDKAAKQYKHLTYDEALQRQLAIMDFSAICQCRDHKLNLRVFNFRKLGALLRIVQGEDEGTLVTVE